MHNTTKRKTKKISPFKLDRFQKDGKKRRCMAESIENRDEKMNDKNDKENKKNVRTFNIESTELKT